MPEGGQVPEDSMKRRRCACSTRPCTPYERSEEEVNIVGRIKVVREGDLTASSLALRCWFRSCRWPGRIPRSVDAGAWSPSGSPRERGDDRFVTDHRCHRGSPLPPGSRPAGSTLPARMIRRDAPAWDSWVACSQRTANRAMGRCVELCLAQVSAARCTLRTTRPGHGAIQRPNILCCKCEKKTILKRVAIPLHRTVFSACDQPPSPRSLREIEQRAIIRLFCSPHRKRRRASTEWSRAGARIPPNENRRGPADVFTSRFMTTRRRG